MARDRPELAKSDLPSLLKVERRAEPQHSFGAEMILVNGKFEVEWEEGMTVSRLLTRLKFSFPLIIVSVDGVLVPREDYAVWPVADGARVQVIHMTAGG